MNNLTKFIIRKPANEVFEAFVDPSKISNFERLPIMLDNKEGWVYMLSCLKADLESGVTNLRAALLK